MEPNQNSQSNESLLYTLRERLANQTLSLASVKAVVQEFDTSPVETTEKKHFSLVKLLYVIGGVIVSLGIIFFIAQIWDDIGSLGRILVTFGLGVLLAVYGTHFMQTQPSTMLGDVLHAVAGLLLPGGAMVILAEFNVNPVTLWPFISVFVAVTLLYLFLLRVLQSSVLVFYAIANATIAIVLIFAELFPRVSEQIYLLFSMVIGIVYIYLSLAFKDVWNRYLTALLMLVGSATFYISSFLSIFEGNFIFGRGHSVFWEILFPFLAVGGMLLATKIQDRILLFVSTVALISYVIYLTGEYFANSIGWPLALVLLGFVIIGLGYTSIKLSKSYQS